MLEAISWVRSVFSPWTFRWSHQPVRRLVDAGGRLELSLADEGDLRLWRMLLYTEGANPPAGHIPQKAGAVGFLHHILARYWGDGIRHIWSRSLVDIHNIHILPYLWLYHHFCWTMQAFYVFRATDKLVHLGQIADRKRAHIYIYLCIYIYIYVYIYI